MDTSKPSKTILLIDDDINIRFVIKKLLSNILINAKIYTSDKGPEGLGLAYILKPNIIIIDTTLPKYSGREVIEFILSNNTLSNSNIILLQEDNDFALRWNLGANYTILSKKALYFPDQLLNIIRNNFEHHEEGSIYKLGLILGRKVIKYSNYSASNTSKISAENNILIKISNIVSFLINQIITSVYLFFFLILVGKKDTQEDLSEDNNEFSSYRTNIYSKFIGTVSIIIILISLYIIIKLS